VVHLLGLVDWKTHWLLCGEGRRGDFCFFFFVFALFGSFFLMRFFYFLLMLGYTLATS
jgi:hypothetical protein